MSGTTVHPKHLFRRALALAALLVTALAPAASLPAEVPHTGVGALFDSPITAGSAPAVGCDAQSMRSDPGPAGATAPACVAPDLESDQAYLVETARPGGTMLHQGLALAIVRLLPFFIHRLAEAISDARAVGLPAAGIFSAYRPPAFGVGRFFDKFNSLHSYGLAVDMLGIGGPGSSEAKLWYEVAAQHGIVCPYGADNRREWNHCQPTGVRSIMAGNPLRDTISPLGPIDLGAMFAMGDALVNGTDAAAGSPEPQPTIDETSSSSGNPGEPRAQVAGGGEKSVETRHGPADPNHDRHRRVKPVAGLAATPYLHAAHEQPKRRLMPEKASLKSGPVKKYRTASLIRHDSPANHVAAAAAHEKAPAKRIERKNARLDRSLKGICRGC